MLKNFFYFFSFFFSLFQLYNSTAENKPESYTMTFDSIRAGSSSTSIFENLQAQLKQKDGIYLNIYIYILIVNYIYFGKLKVLIIRLNF